MKTSLLLSLFSLAAFSLQAAPADKDKLPGIPKENEGRFGVYSFEDAKKEALKKKQPIAFIVQDDKTEEAAEKTAVQKAYWGMEKNATMVLITSRLMGEAKTRLGEAVYAALNSELAGKTMPRMVVMDQNVTVTLGTMTKDQLIAGDEKSFKAYSKEMDEANKNPAKAAAATPAATPAAPGTTPATAPAAPAAPAPAAAGSVAIKDGKPDAWTNTQGKTIQATLLEVAADKVVFLMANGTKIDYPIVNLDAPSKAKVDALKAAQ
ncbi:hypothetical protein BH11VER1_BH11VER1_33180 [soil metagenome]